MERSGTRRARSLLAPGYLGTAARPAPTVAPQPAETGANPCCCSAWSARDCCAQPRVGARTETASSRIVRARRVRRIRRCDDTDRPSTPAAADPHPTPPTSDPMTGNPDGTHAWRSDVQARHPDITGAGPAPISGAPHVVSAPRWRGYWLDDEWRWCDAHHDPGGMSRRYYGQKRRCRHRYHHLAPHHRRHSEVRTRVIRTICANPPRRSSRAMPWAVRQPSARAVLRAQTSRDEDRGGRASDVGGVPGAGLVDGVLAWPQRDLAPRSVGTLLMQREGT